MAAHGRNRTRRETVPLLETMEERALLSASVTVAPRWTLADIGRFFGGEVGKIKDLDAAGYRALLSALQGGAGAEFATLLQRGHVNPLQVILQFATKQRTAYITPGFVGIVPQTLKSYTGSAGDKFNPTAAGAVLQSNGKLSLAAIMRGPIDLGTPVRYVWGLDLGRGATAIWPSHPNVKVDTLVVVDRAANGAVQLTVQDLVNQTTRTLSSRRVTIQGPTVRLKLDPATDLPTGGSRITKAKFTFWVQNHPGGEETVSRFLPDSSLAIGVLPQKPALKK
jgi:hypothetical protein